MLITINKKYTLLYTKFSPFYEALFSIQILKTNLQSLDSRTVIVILEDY